MAINSVAPLVVAMDATDEVEVPATPSVAVPFSVADTEAEVVTVNVVWAVALPVSVATIVLAPAVLDGTVNVAVQPPVALTVGLVGLMVSAEPAKVTDTVLVAMKPV